MSSAKCVVEGGLCKVGKQQCCDGTVCTRLQHGPSAAQTVYACTPTIVKLADGETCSKSSQCENTCLKNCNGVERMGVSCADIRGVCGLPPIHTPTTRQKQRYD